MEPPPLHISNKFHRRAASNPYVDFMLMFAPRTVTLGSQFQFSKLVPRFQIQLYNAHQFITQNVIVCTVKALSYARVDLSK